VDFTEASVLAASVFSGSTGFVLGLRVCGERLNTTWTERHPVTIAEDVRAGRLKMRHLGAHTRRLVARELEALNTGRPEIAADVPLLNEGAAGRFSHLSADQLEALSYDRTPLYRRRPAPARPSVDGDVLDVEWSEEPAPAGRSV
jgi:hypothetical protein